jgi:PPOX class probable F420-dependent enzyme
VKKNVVKRTNVEEQGTGNTKPGKRMSGPCLVTSSSRRPPMIPEEHRQFLESHKLCVVGYARKSGPPSLSPTYYYVDGDEIVFSTTKARGKGRAAARNPELTLCIVDMNPPYPYLMVMGHARVDEAGAVDAMMKVGAIMTGNAVAEAVRPMLEQRAQDEGRVAVRFTPAEFFKTQPVPGGQSSTVVKS